MNYKQKALDHVRSVCPELMELSDGCKIKLKMCDGDWINCAISKQGKKLVLLRPGMPSVHDFIVDEDIKIIGHTPHLEHWLRGIGGNTSKVKINNIGGLSIFKNEKWVDIALPRYNLTKDGKNQDESFYKAYCEIVGYE